jgi:hypothetical protein
MFTNVKVRWHLPRSQAQLKFSRTLRTALGPSTEQNAIIMDVGRVCVCVVRCGQRSISTTHGAQPRTRSIKRIANLSTDYISDSVPFNDRGSIKETTIICASLASH